MVMVIGLMGNLHKLVFGLALSSRTSLAPSSTELVVLLKVMVIPALQNLLMEMSNEWVRLGTMCTCMVLAGSQGMSRLHICVDFRVDPLGNVMVMG